MGFKIYNRDGTTTTISEAEQAEIDAYTKGKSLAEIAAEPPRFAHLLKRRDARPAESPDFPRIPFAPLSRDHLERQAGVSREGTYEQIRDCILAALRGG